MNACAIAAQKDYQIKLNLRIGYLKFRQENMTFENMPNIGEMTIATSCTSEFLKNKLHLTNFRTPVARKGLGSLGSPVMSIHTSHITSIRTPRTIRDSLCHVSRNDDGISINGFNPPPMTQRL
jgi:hypothetical protein